MKKILGTVSVLLSAWLIYRIIFVHDYLNSSVQLGYVVFVIVVLLFESKKGLISETSPISVFRTGDGSTPEEIILQIIREKGQAKRHDLMPKLDMSKSSLVRLLDDMEAKGLIVQVGTRKAAYYTLPEPKKDQNQA